MVAITNIRVYAYVCFLLLFNCGHESLIGLLQCQSDQHDYSHDLQFQTDFKLISLVKFQLVTVNKLDSKAKVRTPVHKWTKRGCTCLYITDHNSHFDITIFMDKQLNPGPKGISKMCRSNTSKLGNANDFVNNDHVRHNDDHTGVVGIQHINKYMYTRQQLFSLRRSSCHHVQSHLLQSLRENGLLKYRGKRGGKTTQRLHLSQSHLSHTTLTYLLE